MLIGIDLRCLPTDGRPGAGVAHAARFLTEALLEQKVEWEWRMYLPVGACGARPDPVGGRTPYASTKDATGSALRSALRSHPCDLMFVPSGACAPGIPVTQIPWVHDLAIFDHPQWFPESLLRRMVTTRLFARGLRRAPIIFAVSEETKNQIVVHLGIDPKKIIVTHEGGDPMLQANNVTRNTQHAALINFCLAIGTIEPRKNFELLLLIWPDVFRQTGRRLLIVGKKGWGNVSIKEGDGIEIRASVGEDEKRQLIKSADLVLVPSLYEGFGLVALEAMQAGTALISSDRGALSEVVGDGGVLLSPDDEEAWKREILRLLEDDGARVEYGRKGMARSEKFSWERTSDCIVSTLHLYLKRNR